MRHPTPSEVKEARLSAGMTQGQAARLVHVTRGAWAFWESGERAIPLATWELFQTKSGGNKKTAQMENGLWKVYLRLSNSRTEQSDEIVLHGDSIETVKSDVEMLMKGIAPAWATPQTTMYYSRFDTIEIV